VSSRQQCLGWQPEECNGEVKDLAGDTDSESFHSYDSESLTKMSRNSHTSFIHMHAHESGANVIVSFKRFYNL
jgi:hypothetical protein